MARSAGLIGGVPCVFHVGKDLSRVACSEGQVAFCIVDISFFCVESADDMMQLWVTGGEVAKLGAPLGDSAYKLLLAGFVEGESAQEGGEAGLVGDVGFEFGLLIDVDEVNAQVGAGPALAGFEQHEGAIVENVDCGGRVAFDVAVGDGAQLLVGFVKVAFFDSIPWNEYVSKYLSMSKTVAALTLLFAAQAPSESLQTWRRQSTTGKDMLQGRKSYRGSCSTNNLDCMWSCSAVVSVGLLPPRVASGRNHHPHIYTSSALHLTPGAKRCTINCVIQVIHIGNEPIYVHSILDLKDKPSRREYPQPLRP